MSGRRLQFARGVASAVIAAQALSLASWILAGALDGSSIWRIGVSDLGALTAPRAWIMNVGWVVLGSSVAVLAWPLRLVLPAHRRKAAVLLFVLAGVGLALMGVFRLDCGLHSHVCESRFVAGRLSWHTAGHAWAGLIATATIVLTPFAIAWALWPSSVAAAALAAGVFGIGVGVVSEVVYRATALYGLADRVQLVAANLWIALVAAGVLYTTRRGPVVMPLTRLRAGAFFAGSWAGDGELKAWPPLVGRLIRARFDLTRTTRFLTDDTWIFEDQAVFAGDRVLTQRLICELQPSGRIHVTGDLVPGGSEVLLDDQGYRLTPYRYLVQLGPLHLTVRCRDRHEVQPDGALVSTVTARWLGVPLVRLTARAQRTDNVGEYRDASERLARA